MQQIADWLKQLGMHEYIQRFAVSRKGSQRFWRGLEGAAEVAIMCGRKSGANPGPSSNRSGR
jgi:hypothetical protein